MSLTDDDKQWIREQMSAQVEEVETRILRAFRNWAHPAEARLRVQKSVSRSLAERMDALEDRIDLLEENGKP